MPAAATARGMSIPIASSRRAAPIPRVALTKAETAAALGVSVDCFDDHVAIEMPFVRCGRLRLYPVKEVQRWLETHTERAPVEWSASAPAAGRTA
jgi:hypothetical protein